MSKNSEQNQKCQEPIFFKRDKQEVGESSEVTKSQTSQVWFTSAFPLPKVLIQQSKFGHFRNTIRKLQNIVNAKAPA